MMIARAGDLFFLGLSEKNLEHLRRGLPIAVDKENDLGMGIKLVIFYGKTEEEMRADLADLIGPDTKVIDKLPKSS